MAMRFLPRFWSALATLPGWATDRREWQLILGDEFPFAERLLRGTGRVARWIDCPAPGGDGCPRLVVPLPSGGLRGVCGNAPAVCEAVELQPEDVVIAAIDRRRLAQALVEALRLMSASAPVESLRLFRVGHYAVAAGVSADVLLSACDPRDPLSQDDLRRAAIGHDPVIILVPGDDGVPGALKASLISSGHMVVPLTASVAAAETGRLVAMQPPELLFRPIHDALAARIGQAVPTVRFPQPPDTQWRDLTFSLTSEETLTCTAPGGSRQVDPGDLGLRSAKNARPTLGWTMLVQLIAAGGTLLVQDNDKVRKQKQALSRALQAAFGVTEDPISALRSKRAYRAAFRCRDERPEGLRRRAPP